MRHFLNEIEPPLVNNDETCNTLAVGLIVGILAPILGVFLGVTFTLVLSLYLFKKKRIQVLLLHLLKKKINPVGIPLKEVD